MRTSVKILLICALALAAASCASVRMGREFDLQRFQDHVQRTATTRAEVRTWLGAPLASGQSVDSNGRHFEEWIYYFGGGTLPDMADAHLKILQIKFDEHGVVSAYNWSQSHQ